MITRDAVPGSADPVCRRICSGLAVEGRCVRFFSWIIGYNSTVNTLKEKKTQTCTKGRVRYPSETILGYYIIYRSKLYRVIHCALLLVFYMIDLHSGSHIVYSIILYSIYVYRILFARNTYYSLQDGSSSRSNGRRIYHIDICWIEDAAFSWSLGTEPVRITIKSYVIIAQWINRVCAIYSFNSLNRITLSVRYNNISVVYNWHGRMV